MEVNELWLSADDLAKLSKRGLRMPGSVRGCRNVAKREKWPSKEVQGRGGKGGILTLYRPPDSMLAAIAALGNGPPPPAVVEIAAYPKSTSAPPALSGGDDTTRLTLENQTEPAHNSARARSIYKHAAKTPDDLSPDWLMLEVLLRVAEYKLQEPMTIDLADKIERVVIAWTPVAADRPDLAARLDRLRAAVALLRPN